MDVKRLRARQADETRQLLIRVARRAFTERGYAATSIEDIIGEAGVARGALYHHFDGKEALFRAVYSEIQAEVVDRVIEAALAEREPWSGARAGLSAFLDACLEPSFRQVVVLDSVSVLQHRAWADNDEPAELPMLRQVLAPLIATEVLPELNVDGLVYVALGGLYGAALFIARSPQPKTARADAEAILDTLIAGLKTHLERRRRTRTRA